MTKTTQRSQIEAQIGLPLIGTVPEVIRLGPVPFGQVVLYRSDLLADCVIKVIQSSPLHSFSTFIIIAPDGEAANRIAKYIAGDNDA